MKTRIIPLTFETLSTEFVPMRTGMIGASSWKAARHDFHMTEEPTRTASCPDTCFDGCPEGLRRQSRSTITATKSAFIVAALFATASAALADDTLPASSNAHQQEAAGRVATQSPPGGRLGIGLILGEPTGLSAKYFLSDPWAVDAAVGWSFADDTDFYLHSDVLWHLHNVFDVPSGEFSFYTGIGGRVKFRDHADDRLGIRIPVGLAYHFESAPVDLFVELAPIMDVAPATRAGITGGIGARWWF